MGVRTDKTYEIMVEWDETGFYSTTGSEDILKLFSLREVERSFISVEFKGGWFTSCTWYVTEETINLCFRGNYTNKNVSVLLTLTNYVNSPEVEELEDVVWSNPNHVFIIYKLDLCAETIFDKNH